MNSDRIFKSPKECKDKNGKKIFLAGGISFIKENWQEKVTKKLIEETDLLIFNPRRDDFDVSKKEMTVEQIKWEYKYLEQCEIVMFYFPSETLCPITLYELGKISMKKDKEIFIAVHPEYKRKDDVIIQTGLVRKEIKVVFSIDELLKQIIEKHKKKD